MTTLPSRGDDMSNGPIIERIELVSPSKTFDKVFKANHWAILVGFASLIFMGGKTMNILSYHSDDITAMKNDIRDIRDSLNKLATHQAFIDGQINSSSPRQMPGQARATKYPTGD